MNKDEFISRLQRPVVVTPQQDFPGLPILKEAGVLINVVEFEQTLHVLFTRRAVHLKHHGGQISFPGGKYESTDLSLKHTALRETEEEVGFSVSEKSVIGALSKYPTISGYSVTPFIAILDTPPTISIDTNEVSDTFYVPLSYLLNPSHYLVHPVIRDGKYYSVYFLPWKNTYIWGATAGMLMNMCTATQF